MTTPRSPHEDEDFRQLTGAFNHPIAPSPRFAQELKARLEQETVAQQATSAAARPVSQRTARGASAPPVARRSWLDVAIAAALIVALLGGSFWYADVRVRNDGPGAPEATRYAAQPLSAVSTPVTESGGGAVFDPSAEHEVTVLDNAPSYFGWSAISGDTLIIGGANQDDVSESGLTALDLRTRDVVWTSSVIPMSQFVVDDSAIYGAFRHTTAWDSRMSAISTTTGELLWESEPLVENTGLDVVSPIAAFTAFRPLVLGDFLYYVDREGTLLALDAGTGDLRWSLALENGTEEDRWGRGGAAVGDEDSLYVVDHQNVIRELDPKTGDEIDRLPMANRPANDYLINLHLQDDVLLAISLTDTFDGTVAFADAISTDNGDVLWSKRLGLAGAGISMTDEIVAMPRSVGMAEIEAGSDLSEPGTYVSFLDLRTGEPVSLYGPSDWAAQMTSASGGVFCINEGMAINCVDMASETRTMVELPYAPGYESVAPVLFWNESAIVLSQEDGVVLLQPKDAQPRQAAGPLPGDPGNTNAYPETIDLSQTFTAEAFGNVDMGAQEMLVVRDDLVFVGGPITDPTSLGIANPTLMSRDIATGEHNWSYQKPSVHLPVQQISTDGVQVYAVLYNPNLPTTYRLIALDGELGDVLWETVPLDEIAGVEPSQAIRPSQPVAVNGTVLVAYGPDVLLALDSESGEVRWSLDAPAPGVAWDAEFEPPTPSVVANGSSAFWSLPNGDVQQIDLNAGKVVLTIADPDEDGQNTRTTLHLRDDVLLVRRGYAVPDVPEKTRIDVYATETGEGLWTVTIDMYMGDITITDDLLIVPASRWIEPSLLERIFPFMQQSHQNEIEILSFDLESGESLDLFSDENDYTNFPDFSAAGDTICMAANTVQCVDREGNEITVEGYEVEAYMSFTPPVYWDGQIIIGNGMGPLTIAKPRP